MIHVIKLSKAAVVGKRLEGTREARKAGSGLCRVPALRRQSQGRAENWMDLGLYRRLNLCGVY